MQKMKSGSEPGFQQIFHSGVMRNFWPIISDGVSRLGLGLETRFLESRSRRSRLGLEGFRSLSRALRLETLHRLFL